MGKNLEGIEIGPNYVQRSDGRFCFRKKYENGDCISLYDRNLDVLMKKVEEEENKRGYRNALLAKDYTVEEWFYVWFDTFKAPTIRESSGTPIKSRVKNSFLDKIGHIKLKELLSVDVQDALNKLTSTKYSRKGLSNALSTLRESLDVARDNKLTEINAAKGIKVPYTPKSEENKIFKKFRFMKQTEIEIFLEAVKGSWFYELYYVMIFMGLRIGEIGGLKWCDINFEKNEITLKRAIHIEYSGGKKKMWIGELKNKNAYRNLPMANGVREALLHQKEKMESLKKKKGDKFKCIGEYEGLVFATSVGSPVTKYVIENSLNLLVDKINENESLIAATEGREPILFEHLYPHALRHTYASLCYKVGVDPKTLQKLMGHEKISTTLDIYTHLDSEFVKKDISKLNAAIEEIHKNLYEGTKCDTFKIVADKVEEYVNSTISQEV